MLALLSTRIGTLAGRIGARRFLVAGPLLMALGLLWYARLPVDSASWRASLDDPQSLIPPTDVLIDVLPYSLLFGLGISLVVAPLTSTLMGSIPGRFSGLGSAINNSISRVGQPLIGALVFIVISASYYASLAANAGLDMTDATVRHDFQPLNPPPAGVSAELVAAANQASIDSFRLAMVICAGLLAIGAAVSWFGLRERGRAAVSLRRAGARRAGRRLTATAGPASASDLERRAVPRDDDVGRRQDSRPAALQGRRHPKRTDRPRACGRCATTGASSRRPRRPPRRRARRPPRCGPASATAGCAARAGSRRRRGRATGRRGSAPRSRRSRRSGTARS